jgi:phosphate starvation-inducible protein PhoH and related proteins
MSNNGTANGNVKRNFQRVNETISQLATEDSLELHFDDHRFLTELLGQHDAHLRVIEAALDVRIGVNGSGLKISGGHIEQALAGKLLSELYELLKRGYPIYNGDVDYAIRILRADHNVDLKDIFLDQVYISANKRIISPKSLNQKAYVEAIRAHDIVFGIGPAGTGKTYLAMAMALAALMKNQVTRMVLCRPAVEAGEKLGFLPGDLAEKVNPYLRPLYDALHDMVDYDRARRMLERGTIEVAPLAFMRGRTLNDSFIILDEAQNTTSEQMKMFLTRLGYGSKAVITGDITQIDLPSGKLSGLKETRTVLADTPGIKFVHFNERDVVRHRLVQAIITAYESFNGDRTLPLPLPPVEAKPATA